MISINQNDKKKRLVSVATVKARVNVVHTESSQREVEPIDGPLSFPPVNPNKVFMPFTLCINGFDVHRVLVDPSSATDLFQLPAFTQMKLSSNILNLAG